MKHRTRKTSLAVALSAATLAVGAIAPLPMAISPIGAAYAVENPCAPAAKKPANPCAPAAKKPANPCAPKPKCQQQ